MFYSKKLISISDLLTKDKDERRKRLKFLFRIVGLPAIFLTILLLMPLTIPVGMEDVVVGFSCITVLAALYVIFK
ncbi:hypothetical protein [Paenibacillus sp. USHLN196]|uniref:hypothetical protein n=1 Tax=Paenibacillus sp. USHLN196 TaxID=3081291 RepID=UPI0030172478